MHSLKLLLSRFFEQLGYSVVPLYYEHHISIIRYLRKLFSRYDIDLVVDVGANKGQYYEFLRKWVMYKGKIISFEPIRENVDILRCKKSNDDRWFIQGVALGSRRERKTFYLT
jgi:hypothetical protein